MALDIDFDQGGQKARRRERKGGSKLGGLLVAFDRGRFVGTLLTRPAQQPPREGDNSPNANCPTQFFINRQLSYSKILKYLSLTISPTL